MPTKHEGIRNALQHAIDLLERGEEDEARLLAAMMLRELLAKQVIDLDAARERRRRYQEYLDRGWLLTPDLAELFSIAVALQLYDVDALDLLMADAKKRARDADCELACSKAIREHARHSRWMPLSFRDDLNALAKSIEKSIADIGRSDAAAIADVEANGPMSRHWREWEKKRDAEVAKMCEQPTETVQ